MSDGHDFAVLDLGSAEVPSDRAIDGRDITDILLGVDGANSPHDAFLYYIGSSLEAVRVGRWKLHCAKAGAELCELYDLEADIGETTDVSAEHPDVLERLMGFVEEARADLGDTLSLRDATGARRPGRHRDG